LVKFASLIFIVSLIVNRYNRIMPHLLFITGGVISSLGKGLSGASLALLLKARGLKVKQLKMDPYLNVDPGTMSPFQHGEVFVTHDGAETDLDLGHYERFTNQNVSSKQNVTSGKIYERVLAKERQGKYLGKTVQVIPHITDEIKEHIMSVAKGVDVCLIEVGGTVGDIESLPFLEAIRQLKFDLGENNVCYVHLTLVPYIASASELKTKPTQHSVQELRRIGIQPDILLCRSDRVLSDEIKAKISLFVNVPASHVIAAADVENLYDLPLALHREKLDTRVCQKFKLRTPKPNLSSWKKVVQKSKKVKDKVSIAMVGKYVDVPDRYISLNEALLHGALANGKKVEIQHIDSEIFEEKNSQKELKKVLSQSHGILVPGGFGERGTEGKIKAIRYARENNIPYFGICLGMQLMAVEFARNICGLKDAHSAEFSEKSKNKIIDYMRGQKEAQKGGSMRLGAYNCQLPAGSLARKAYSKSKVVERHRHRLEFQNRFSQKLKKAGMLISGVNPEEDLVEILELKDHPWFLGCQFHPEFLSRPERPHPLFVSFVKAAIDYKNS